MLDFVKTYPWLTAGAAAGVIGAGALGYWLNSGPGEVDNFPKEVRNDLKEFLKKLRKKVSSGGEIKLSSAERAELKKFMNISAEENTLAEKFMDRAEPIIGAVLSVTGKNAVFQIPRDAEIQAAFENSIEEMEKLLKKMEKAEKEGSWLKRL